MAPNTFFFFFYHIREQKVSHLSPPPPPPTPTAILLSPHSRSASLSSPHPRSDAVRRREEGRIECPPFLPSPVKFQSQATVKGGIVSPWWGMPSLCSSKKRLHLARNLEESREVLWRFSRGWVGIGRPGWGEEEALPHSDTQVLVEKHSKSTILPRRYDYSRFQHMDKWVFILRKAFNQSVWTLLFIHLKIKIRFRIITQCTTCNYSKHCGLW